eukprot:524659_1
MFHKLFTTSIRRIGYLACASAASLSVPLSPKENKFLSNWETAFRQWEEEDPENRKFNYDNYQKEFDHPLQNTSTAYEYDLKLLTEMADDFVIFHGTNCIDLTNEVATILQKDVCSLELGRYADGEISVRLGENVRGKSVYIIQSTSTPVHENLMELLLTISAARRSSALRICAIVPYFGYSRADRKRMKRETIAASDIAKLFETVGVDQIVTVDLHRRQIQGFFEHTNVDNLESLRAMLPVLLEKDLFNPVICCASDTGVFRAKKLAQLLKIEGIVSRIAFITSKRKSDKMIEFQEMSSHHRISNINETEIIGDVKHRDVIILDDMIDTGSRLINAAQKCKGSGAFRVFACATHGIFSGDALFRINKCKELDEIFVTNTIYPPRIPADMQGDEALLNCDKLSYVSIGPIIAEAIRRIQIKNSLSSMTHINC